LPVSPGGFVASPVRLDAPPESTVSPSSMVAGQDARAPDDPVLSAGRVELGRDGPPAVLVLSGMRVAAQWCAGPVPAVLSVRAVAPRDGPDGACDPGVIWRGCGPIGMVGVPVGCVLSGLSMAPPGWPGPACRVLSVQVVAPVNDAGGLTASCHLMLWCPPARMPARAASVVLSGLLVPGPARMPCLRNACHLKHWWRGKVPGCLMGACYLRPAWHPGNDGAACCQCAVWNTGGGPHGNRAGDEAPPAPGLLSADVVAG
jgi:hypothetical protein